MISFKKQLVPGFAECKAAILLQHPSFPKSQIIKMNDITYIYIFGRIK